MPERAPHPPEYEPPVAHGAIVSLGPDGIVDFDFRRCGRITLAIIEAAHARHLALCSDRKVPVLLRGHQVGAIDYDAQRFGSSASVVRVVSAMALVACSFLERHLARLFLLYHRPPYPTRVFDDESAAREWLRGFLDTD
jgi:hypothetical protein